MEPQDYPVEHFRLMVRIAEDLRTLPAQIVAHEYCHDAFGSWTTTVRRRGGTFRIAFDGKEREVRLERETTKGKASEWAQVCLLPTTDPSGAQAIPDMVARLKTI